jgi:hypothetical protein
MRSISPLQRVQFKYLSDLIIRKIIMTIRDRGKIKWAAAYLQPEQAKMQRDFWLILRGLGSQSLTSIRQRNFQRVE